jgi:hypothetical protein
VDSWRRLCGPERRLEVVSIQIWDKHVESEKMIPLPCEKTLARKNNHMHSSTSRCMRTVFIASSFVRVEEDQYLLARFDDTSVSSSFERPRLLPSSYTITSCSHRQLCVELSIFIMHP